MSSRELEKLVAFIQKQLSPDAEVIHDIKLPSRGTSTKRQIDVLVKQKIGQYEITIAIDAKDYKKPVDVKGVEEFYGLIQDVGANKGVLVCPAGFTKAAKERAEGWQIDLYVPVDTGEHKWQAKVSIPAVCDFRRAAVSFGISGSAPKPFCLPPNFWSSLLAYDKDGNILGTPIDVAVKKWNDDKLPIEVGEHSDLLVFDAREVLVDNGYGEQVPVNITMSIFVEKHLYYGDIPISKISGFKDELTGRVITNAFTTDFIDPDEITEKWKPITEDEELPMPPGIRFQGIIMWS